MRKLARRTAAIAACLALVAPAVRAQELADWSRGWTGQATLYAWLPVINGKQKGPDGQPVIDLDTSDVLSALDMAFMGSAIFQKEKFGILLDAVYADLGTDGTWLRTAVTRVDTETTTKLGMYTLAAMYRVYDDPKGFVDVYGGARYFNTSIDFRLSTAHLGDADFTKKLDWTDPIVGVRGGMALNDRWALAGFADMGGFDGSSDTSWELYGGANYAFTERWQGTLGYRYVSIQKEVTQKAALDISLQGPVFGITYRF
jgi:opacity protein-like surface antigen